jgi:DNA-binding IclR family transcriptional regulator
MVFMDTASNDDATHNHRVPVIDKMMDILVQLERRDNGVTIRELVTQLKLPRTTIYRVLNTLQIHDMVRRDDAGAYYLGRRLLGFAAHVSTGRHDFDLAAVSLPYLENLADELGEGVKLSVIDDAGILVVAAVQGRKEFALSVAPGQRMPIHAGAASKILLAYLPEDRLTEWLSKPLVGYTSKSITDPKRLATELTRIKRLGWAQDKGENAPSIQAYAAPVFARDGEMIAAVSVPFLAGTEASRMEEIRLAVIQAAKAMTQGMPL